MTFTTKLQKKREKAGYLRLLFLSEAIFYKYFNAYQLLQILT